ncbi:hypothetical protein TSUD_86430 [Trifolium subterraneum]|uniref:VQ domain-containing protein n=1 Tax=Trifolium subterraneum TaxID=3900 RepID=A0A2Z6P3U3_TRISU|nr:hypothetical protein TSUD_86430 [Trifolium subterraneum]
MDSNNNIKSPRNNFPSPRHSHSSSSSSSNSNNNTNNGTTTTVLNPLSPYPPKPITRSEPGNPYPTTFVQADPSSFKHVVQMLTGSTETTTPKHVSSNNSNSNSNSNNNNVRNHIPPIKTIPKKQQSGFKLYERRNSLKNLHLNPLLPIFSSNSTNPSGFSPRNTEILSPSILDFPALVLSPVTPLIPDPFNRTTTISGSPKPVLNTEAEEKAIREKGFFLHPSPSTTPRETEPPRLLPLFPTTSPKASGPSSSST